jgi:serine/threonine-protein kinase
VTRQLGRGGMASVYLATDLRHDRPVALKVLHPELSSSLGVERFEQEIKLAARLQHPHILGVYDSGEADGLLWFTMPFVEGESLRERLIRENRLPLDDALRIAWETADALEFAHQRGVVHRDIKPENILLTGGHALVADFGIARALRDSTSQRLTAAGLAIGTPAYMSPEQAMGEATDARSDEYSLACVIYEMLAGAPPFQAATTQAVLAHRLTRDAPRLRAVLPNIPEAVEGATLKALARVAEDRFQTVAEFADALCRDGSKTTVPVRDKSIAVLPFTNLSPDPENEYFTDGMTEEVINALAKVEGLHVVSRTSTFAFKGTRQDIRSIGAQLGIRNVLEGSVRRAGNRLRVSVQLTDVTNGFHLWSDTYDRQTQDIFAIQDEISRAVVNAMRVRLLGHEAAALVKPPTVDLEAYSAYLKGRHFWNRRTAEDVSRGMAYFYEALGRDPGYALAHAGLADSYAILGFYCVQPPWDAFPKAKSAALKALAIEPDLTEAHPALAYVAMYHDYDWTAAEREFRRAIALNPGYATAHQWYGNFLAVMGRFADCIEEFGKALELDPLSGIKAAARGWGHFFSRDYGKAIAQCRHAIELEPELAIGHSWLGQALEEAGAIDEAVTEFEEGVRLSGRNAVALGMLAHALALQGRTEEARSLIAELAARRDGRYASPYDVAKVYVALGEPEAALQQLELGMTERTHWMALLKVDPKMDPLRSHPRFQLLLERMAFPSSDEPLA